MRAPLLVSVLLLCACPKPGRTDAGPLDSGRSDAGFDAGVRDAGPPPCPPGETRCLIGCRNLRNDEEHCGSCGASCNANEHCVNSMCRPDCIGDVIDCGGPPICVNPKTNPENCGRCGNACTQTELCDGGNCWQVPGRALCNGVITDTLTDVTNCGMCGQSCMGSDRCQKGLCCATNQLNCSNTCVDALTDRNNCGGCSRICGSSQVCSNGVCLNCPAGHQQCNNACIDTRTDPQNCGACFSSCNNAQTCINSMCTCPAVLTTCGTDCVDRFNSVFHCGACNMPCAAGQLCVAGVCTNACPAGFTLCSGRCVDTTSSNAACGSCSTACGSGQECDGGSCVSCVAGPDSDCDHDGYTVAQGDCCDTAGGCAGLPDQVNPGAFEVLGNGVDENCNGLVDTADTLDVAPCDLALASNSTNPIDAAKALDICRTYDAGTWGLISAEWQLTNGQALSFADGKSIRPGFGASWLPQRGTRLLVISSGLAADATQTSPGPNGGPMIEQSEEQGSVADMSVACPGGTCLQDWFSAANPPVKRANELPESPVCPAGAALDPELANDSVMLVLRIRAPTNARAFSLSGAFFSVEYPEYVCSDYNDQLVALVTTPTPTWPLPNPPDKNLATFRDGLVRYPVGINVAAGAGIFEVCERPGSNLACDDMYVSTRSCSAGLPLLNGTGFEKPNNFSCAQGGATRWLTVRGNVRPGEDVTLRLAIWDVGDPVLDSTALLDAFRWELNSVTPGTE